MRPPLRRCAGRLTGAPRDEPAVAGPPRVDVAEHHVDVRVEVVVAVEPAADVDDSLPSTAWQSPPPEESARPSLQPSQCGLRRSRWASIAASTSG